MAYMALENLLDKTEGSVYKLVVLASRRAMELAEGQPKLVDVADASLKPSIIALQEIMENRLLAKAKTKMPQNKASGKYKEIVLGVTASVAVYKAGDLVRRLRDEGFGVTVVMTDEAKKFIHPRMFEALSGNKAYCGMFEQNAEWDIEHISLAQKADLVLIAPATANIIAKIAAGICDDLLTCVVCATEAQVAICPAMNSNMYLNKITQANITKLENLGYHFVLPSKRQPCLRQGRYRLLG